MKQLSKEYINNYNHSSSQVEKNNENEMKLEMVFLNQRKTNIIWYHLYVEPKKRIQTNLFTKQKQSYRYRKQSNGVCGDKSGNWVGPRHTITYIIGNW